MCISVFGKRLSRKGNNVVVFSICFPHRSTAAIQTTLVTPVAIRSWTISSIICTALQVVTGDAASGTRGIFIKVPFFQVSLSSSGSYPLDPSGLGDPAGSNATAGLGLRVTGTHKPLHHKVCTEYNSNKSPTRCNHFSVYYSDVYLQLNMFRAFSRPSSGAQWLQWQPLVLPSYRGDNRAVFVVGPAGV